MESLIVRSASAPFCTPFRISDELTIHVWYPQRSGRESDQHIENRWVPVKIFGPWLFAANSLFFWTLVKVCVKHKSCFRSCIKCVNDRCSALGSRNPQSLSKRVAMVSRGSRQGMLRGRIGRQGFLVRVPQARSGSVFMDERAFNSE
jgi:hypothetical protein